MPASESSADVRAAAARARDRARARHRSGGDSFEVVQGLSEDTDSILLALFDRVLGDERRHVTMLAVGGYGRRELCPRSDVDLLLIRDGESAGGRIERLVRCLWDGGFQLGHAVRTPQECYEFMRGDLTTANAVLECRYLGGSREIHDAFQRAAIRRYVARHRDSFVGQKIELLRRSIEDPRRTIYVVEPHLKEGACGLRDVQRVMWIENMRHGGGISFDGLFDRGFIPREDVVTLRDAYRFYLRVRCEIHFSNNVRQDILERDSVLRIARTLGYGDGLDDRSAVEGLMGDYYRHARLVYRFLRFYVEAGARPVSWWRRWIRRLRAESAAPNLLLEGGALFLAATPREEEVPDGASAAEGILDVFLVAQEREARLSERLCESVRKQADRLEASSFHEPEVTRSLRRLLQRGRGVGRLLKTLHETGILGKILPEFGALDCLVSFDGHHQFTVDEHTLKTLLELDRIESDENYPEPEFRRVLLEIKDPLPLRLALLLHDTGKGAPGDHSVSGTEAATRICERLGFDDKVTDIVDFLVYRHLELYEVSELRDFTEDGVVGELAKVVETEERLKMLYLLTYIDIVSVGAGTWTQWKGAQLSELFQRTLIHLRTGESHGDHLEARLASAGVVATDRDRVLDHCAKMGGSSYGRETIPERMIYHLRIIDEFIGKREMQVFVENRVGYHEIAFCGADRSRLFADLTGLLYSEGLNVLGARIFSRSDGIVIDLFQVEIADAVQLTVEERADRIRRKLRRVESKRQMVDDFIRQRDLSYRSLRWRKPLYGPSVTFDNESSPTATVIEVRAGDRPGLLYDLAQGIYRLGLDLRTAKVSTLLDRARDAFYVVERDGRKIDNPARRTEIVDALNSCARRPVDVLRSAGLAD